MKFSASLLGSKVARRILLLFILCSLLPLTALTLITFGHVMKQLTEQSQSRLQWGSKALGLSIYERLLFLKMEMRMVASAFSETPGGTKPTFPPELRERLKKRFNALSVLPPQGESLPLLGRAANLPQAGPAQRKHLSSGKSLLFSRYEPGTAPRLYMGQALDPGDLNRGVLLGEISDKYLWGLPDQNTLSPLIKFTVLDPDNNILVSTLPDPSSLPQELSTGIAGAVYGQFEWTYRGQEYLARYRPLFLQEEFYEPKWTVIVSESKSDVFSPMTDFKAIYPLIAAISIFMVTLLSINQIRRNMTPLERLREGTHRLAEKKFDCKITVSSGDEFEELAESFNVMAVRLGRQFNALSTIGDVQRAILSTLGTQKLVSTVLSRVPDVLPCDAVSVTLLEPNSMDDARTYIRTRHTQQEGLEGPVRFAPEDLKKISDSPDSLILDGEEDVPTYLQALAGSGIQSFLILPIFLSGKLEGVIALGHCRSPSYSQEDLLQVRQLADQVAVALSNTRMVEQIHSLAYYDGLTHLPNRQLFKERLGQVLPYAKRYNRLAAVLFLDLDGFKRINDTLGHDLGDRLLHDTGERLVHCLRKTDSLSRISAEDHILSRMGGDEFTLLLPDIGHIQDAAKVAQRILGAFSEPFMLGTQEVYITASLGITICPSDGGEVDILLKNADTAMYHAKRLGGNTYQFYTQSMHAAALERLVLEGSLRKALEKNQFVLYYQPKVEIQTGRIVGLEALIRWQHPDMGLVPPIRFIPLAEESGLIAPIGQWVLRTACAQNKAWQAAGLPPLPVSANLSGRQFKQEALIESIRDVLSETGLPPQYLELELTESIIMENVETIINTLHEFKAIGVTLSVDDFGTGYSSLSYLRRFPLDSLKIDKSFIRDITSNPDEAGIIRAIVTMGHSLKLKVIAEGVETEQQLNFLREQGCDEVQGYLTGKPMPADEVPQCLKKSI